MPSIAATVTVAPDGNGFLAGILGFTNGSGNISRYAFDGTFLSTFAAASQSNSPSGTECRDRGERPRVLLKVFELAVGNCFRRPDGRESIGCGVWERSKQNSADDAEDRGRSTDTECEREERDGREAR